MAKPEEEKRPPSKHFDSRWKAGESGNPGGKSPRFIIGPNGESTTLPELARAKTVDMLEVLASIAKDTQVEPQHRVSAASKVLERGWGSVKPATDEDADSPKGGTVGEEILHLLGQRLPN